MSSAAPHPIVSNSRFTPFWAVLTISAAAWLSLFVIFPPSAQNFPLIDDWAWAKSAIVFAHGGGIHYFHWASMYQLGQWLWAFPFIRTLGDSFVVLRLSTIVLSWVGLLAFYDLVARKTGDPRAAAVTALALALDPLFFMLSGTFMTDVPTLSFALIAVALYDRALGDGSYAALAGATLAAVLGVITRLNLAALPAVALVMWLFSRDRWKRLRYLVSLAVPTAAAWLTHHWFEARADIRPVGMRIVTSDLVFTMSYHMLHMAGLAAFPLWLADPRPRAPKVFTLALLAMGCVAYWLWQGRGYLLYSGLFPEIDGLITRCGTYSPIQYIGPRPIVLSEGIRVILTAAGCLGAAGIIDRFGGECLAGRMPGPLIILAISQMPMVILPFYVYDRYFVMFLPAGLALCAPQIRWTPRQHFRLLPIAVFGLAAVALMHDWLAWNSARWELGRKAVAEGVKPLDIEGGLEWNGWHWIGAGCPADPAPLGPFALDLTHRSPGFHEDGTPSDDGYFPSISGTHGLAFVPPEGCRIMASKPYSQWLLRGEHQFYWVTSAKR